MARESRDYSMLAKPAYLLAGLLIVIPMMDLVTNILPARLGDPQWRYGSLGLFAGFSLTPLLGLLVLAGAAVALDHARMLWIAGIASMVIGVLLVLSLGLFVLDVLQIRGNVNPDLMRTFDIGAAKAVVKIVGVAGSMLWMGWASWRVGQGRIREKKRGGGPELVARKR